MPDILPESLSSLGKINQFLSQLIIEQSNFLTNSQEIVNYYNFFINLCDTLVTLLYLKEHFNKSKMTTLFELLTQSEKDFPNIGFKYSIPRFDLPKFKTYSSRELKLNLLSIENFYESLSNNLMLINEMNEFNKQDFY
jgi:hypothetical protein